MAIIDFEDARRHVGHKIQCVIYGDEEVALECVTCNEVLYSIGVDEEETPECPYGEALCVKADECQTCDKLGTTNCIGDCGGGR